MLPRINVVVPTDAFYPLSIDEERDLNEDGGEMLTAEPFRRGREAGEEGATFRIRTYAADGTTPIYHYYDAASLWRWAQTDARFDPRRNPWQYEDWMALHDQYAPDSPVPSWVQDLHRTDGLRVVRTEGRAQFWDDRHGAPRLVREEYASGMTIHFAWNEARGVYFRSHSEYSEDWRGNPNARGTTKHFQFYDQPDPDKQNYGLYSNWSRLDTWVKPREWQRFFAGPPPRERMQKEHWNATGETWFYSHSADDLSGEDYLTMRTFDAVSPAAGQIWHYTNHVAGQEALYKVVHPNGQRDIYDGEEGQEHKVRSLIPGPPGTGDVVLEFEGPKGQERVVRVNPKGLPS